MVVRRHQPDLLAGSRGPDIRQVEDLQRFARRQVHRHPKAANHCSLAKGGSVYPWDASSERTPSSALPCCSTAPARRLFASRSAAVVRRCSAIRKATTAPANSHGRSVFLNSIQIFIRPPETNGRVHSLAAATELRPAAHTDLSENRAEQATSEEVMRNPRPPKPERGTASSAPLYTRVRGLAFRMRQSALLLRRGAFHLNLAVEQLEIGLPLVTVRYQDDLRGHRLTLRVDGVL